MKTYFFPFSEQPVSNWSGGSTRQLAIYPFDAELAKRDFIFRISTATVEIEKSSFSKFDGFQRILMILEGELKIDHKDHHTKKLGPFDTDAFDGSWETAAEGKVVDFNVIYSDKVKNAEVKKQELSKGQGQILESSGFTGIYVLSGSMKMNDRELKEKDFVLVEQEFADDQIELTTAADCKYILAFIDIP